MLSLATLAAHVLQILSTPAQVRPLEHLCGRVQKWSWKLLGTLQQTFGPLEFWYVEKFENEIQPLILLILLQLISLIYGGHFNIFRPRNVLYGYEEYNLEVLKRQFQYFGPFPAKYEEIANRETVEAILYLMDQIPQSHTTPFFRTTEREVCEKDKVFIGKIMMMDWRDRPTAKELLEDDWFKEDD